MASATTTMTPVTTPLKNRATITVATPVMTYSRTFVPPIPFRGTHLPATPSHTWAFSRRLVLVGHGVPVCPRYVPAVRYVPLSLAILPCGAIRQVLAHPSG